MEKSRKKSKSLVEIFVCKELSAEDDTSNEEALQVYPASDTDSYVTAASRTSVLFNQIETHSNPENTSSATDSDYKTPSEKLATEITLPEHVEEGNSSPHPDWATFDDNFDPVSFSKTFEPDKEHA